MRKVIEMDNRTERPEEGLVAARADAVLTVNEVANELRCSNRMLKKSDSR